MPPTPDKPVIVQSDRSILLETDGPTFEDARDHLASFAELVKSPEHIHTYRISNLSLWNAAAAGFTAAEVSSVLTQYAKFPVPPNIPVDIAETVSRYGRVKLERIDKDTLKLVCPDKPLLAELARNKKVKEYLGDKIDDTTFTVLPAYRGVLKQALITVGYPAEDIAGYTEGALLPMALRETAASGVPFNVRDYQREAADVFHAGGKPSGSHGVIVLPCGAGKTIVAIAAMQMVQQHTLILATNGAAVSQWVREILDKTSLTEDQVGAYTGDTKQIRPVTVATYQILTWRASREQNFAHLHLFADHNWGLLIYDEVHLLPAPVFGATADLQARRRLGLTATLVREDGRIGDVFSLVGPQRYSMPWRTLEADGHIATVTCSEVLVEPSVAERSAYQQAPLRQQGRCAASTDAKHRVVARIAERHPQ